jgi:hypothetical protein
MSDNEAEMSQTDSTWEAGSAFSSNGSEPREGAVATDARPDADVDDRLKFLTDLTAVMQTTAATERARNAELTESRRKTHIDSIRAREAMEAEELRELAKEDVKGIDAWSEGEIKRIKLERERRIASRREQLQIRLEEHRTVIGREVDAVEGAVGSYRAEMDDFFTRLGGQTDPVEFARQAGSQPGFPDLTKVGTPQPVAAAPDYGYVVSAPAAEAVAEAPQASVAEAEAYAPAEPYAAPESYAEPEPVAQAEPVIAEAPVAEQVEVQAEQVEVQAEQVEAQAEQVEVQAEQVEVQAAEQVYEQPAEQSYEQPAEQSYEQPAEQSYEQPAEQSYEQPAEQSHEQPAEQSHEQPAEQSYEQQPEPVGAEADAPMVGVMDPDAGSRPVETPWESGVAAEQPAETPDAAPDAVPVAHAESASEAGEGETEGVAAEPQVVMPRSSGAGSWLRWPSSSVDRSDPNR